MDGEKYFIFFGRLFKDFSKIRRKTVLDGKLEESYDSAEY